MQSVQNTHIEECLPRLLRAFIQILAVMNGPERDQAMLEASGLSVERALCPLLVLVDQFGPLGIVELAGKIGRDYSTVSRQVARLEELGLLTRHVSPLDKRIKEARITARGKATTAAIDSARLAVASRVFSDWSQLEFENLVTLTEKLVEDLAEVRPEQRNR